MPDKPLTPARCDALFATKAGKRVLDAAVAVLKGWRREPCQHNWRRDHNHHWVRGNDVWAEDGEMNYCGHTHTPPPYATCAPDAPDYGKWLWELMRAVWDAGKAGAWSTEIVLHSDGSSVVDCNGSAADPPYEGAWGRSLTLQFIKALAAAGKLQENGE